jgi:DNA polymerase III alpha subunit (gram-positive type)
LYASHATPLDRTTDCDNLVSLAAYRNTELRKRIEAARASVAVAHDEPVFYFITDVETTGLDRVKDEPWEIAWTIRSMSGRLVAKRCMLIEHRTKPSQWTLENTNYLERMASGGPLHRPQVVLRALRADLAPCGPRKRILVGSKPEFDDAHIAKLAPDLDTDELYHHHFIDVGQQVATVLDLPRPHNLIESAMLLGIPVDYEAIHTSTGDRDLAETVFWTAREMRRRLACDLAPMIWTPPEDNDRG